MRGDGRRETGGGDSMVCHAGHLPSPPRRTDSMGMPLVRRSFTVGEYHRMAEAGILGEDDRVELIDGQVVALTPIGPDHGSCVNRLTALFAPLAGGQASVRVQNPVVWGGDQGPGPSPTGQGFQAD